MMYNWTKLIFLQIMQYISKISESIQFQKIVPSVCIIFEGIFA